ncbi:anti-sigma factor [Streptomyces sp. TRM66268-LWL]|uniref:Regulator of SigK n=1 Tax=Streptomyces polyasparticus TaxID=2767826 RepID=A0ABR7SIP0_9ACTN|nr:anti-sigma factor [Streptomyces polyasparticus]MBC9715370.1 anti-sigma factor [Streptomyces polyasparticus]
MNLPLRPHSLAGPYALDALDGRELHRFERHLSRCARCRDQVRALQTDTLRLARAASGTAPAGMRERVLTAVRITAQETVPRPAGARRAPRLVPVAAAAATLALIAAALLGVQLSRTQERLDREQAQARAIAQVLAAPDSRATGERFPDGSTVVVVSSPNLRRAVVTVTGLQDPPSGKDHQLWLAGAGKPRSLGLLNGEEPLVARDLGGPGGALAVTAEPDGGSPSPTGRPLVQLALESTVFGK